MTHPKSHNEGVKDEALERKYLICKSRFSFLPIMKQTDYRRE